MQLYQPVSAVGLVLLVFLGSSDIGIDPYENFEKRFLAIKIYLRTAKNFNQFLFSENSAAH